MTDKTIEAIGEVISGLFKKCSKEEFEALLLELNINCERLDDKNGCMCYCLTKEVGSDTAYADVAIDRTLYDYFTKKDGDESFIYRELLPFIEALMIKTSEAA